MSKIVSLNLKEDLYNELKEVAESKQLSLNAIIRLAILDYIRK